jgi:2-polyprenyl-3-methyl-5-hydroxy-6-metoxy-1,4-benzoquinol methylase
MVKTQNWENEGNVHIGMANKPQLLPYHKLIAELALKHTKAGQSILDVGCGRGQLASLISKQGERHLYVADAYQACLDETAKNANVKQAFLISEEAFDIDAKITGGPYDLVILSHVLEHLPYPIEAINKVLSLTKPGGVIILAVPNPVRPNILISNIFQRHYVNRGHIHAWDMSHWRNFLENINGLDVIEYAHDFIQIPGCYRLPVLQQLGEGLAKIVPWWSFSNIAVIRKGL